MEALHLRDRKSILYLTNRLPYPPNKGDKIRTFHQIDHLAFSHDVYCACFIDRPGDARHVSSLRRWCKDVIAVPWSRPMGLVNAAMGCLAGRPFTEAAFSSHEMRRRLRRLCNVTRFDVVVAFSSMMAHYALEVPARRRVIDLCDVDSEKWRDYAGDAPALLSWIYSMEARRLRRLEQDCAERFDAVSLITEREKRHLGPIGTSSRVHVVSNGVRPPNPTPLRASRCAPVIGFIGSMDYKPNADAVRRFVRFIWPAVKERIPNARFNIIGRNPTPAVRALARAPGVTVTGEVREPRLQITRCRVMVAPLLISRGIPNKVLEGMAAGRPVVVTPSVAETIDAVPGRDLLVGESDRLFAEHVIHLCLSDERCDTIGLAGYRYVAAAHSWDVEMSRFEDIVVGNANSDAQELPIARTSARSADAEGLTPATPVATQRRRVRTPAP